VNCLNGKNAKKGGFLLVGLAFVSPAFCSEGGHVEFGVFGSLSDVQTATGDWQWVRPECGCCFCCPRDRANRYRCPLPHWEPVLTSDQQSAYGASIGWIYQGKTDARSDAGYLAGVEGQVLSVSSVNNVYGGSAGKGALHVSGANVSLIFGAYYENVGAYYKFGGSLLKTQFEGRGFDENDTAWSIRPSIGFGVYYDLAPNLRAMAELQGLWADVGESKQRLIGAEVALFSAGVKYRF
jgi:hypothetical protein